MSFHAPVTYVFVNAIIALPGELLLIFVPSCFVFPFAGKHKSGLRLPPSTDASKLARLSLWDKLYLARMLD